MNLKNSCVANPNNAVYALCWEISIDRIGAPSIRANALRFPPSSRTATFSGTPMALAFTTAASTIRCASSLEMLFFSMTLDTDISLRPFVRLQPGALPAVASRIVLRIDVFNAEGPNRGHLRDVFAGFRPVEVGRVSRQHDDATGRIGLQLIGIEPIAKADVEHSRHDGVDAILGVAMGHEFHAARDPDPDRVRTGLRRMAHDDCQTDRGWKRWERLPLEIFGQR